ncbi:hypothetical protein N7G274_000792 [Stereocaulon virgatum]|uniref:Uncharacterized protein n=1 Tax=Stereocaulon virgatum TaxID=373712 RepID=A0ABR4AQ45_9LECA
MRPVLSSTLSQENERNLDRSRDPFPAYVNRNIDGQTRSLVDDSNKTQASQTSSASQPRTSSSYHLLDFKSQSYQSLLIPIRPVLLSLPPIIAKSRNTDATVTTI